MRARTGALSGRLRNTSYRMYVSTGYAVQATRTIPSVRCSFTDVEPAWRIRLLMSVIKAEIIIMFMIMHYRNAGVIIIRSMCKI